MRKDVFEKRVEAVVVNAEADYIATHTALANALQDIDSEDAQKEMSLAMEERYRTVKKDKYDEEEYIIGCLEKKKKK